MEPKPICLIQSWIGSILQHFFLVPLLYICHRVVSSFRRPRPIFLFRYCSSAQSGCARFIFHLEQFVFATSITLLPASGCDRWAVVIVETLLLTPQGGWVQMKCWFRSFESSVSLLSPISAIVRALPSEQNTCSATIRLSRSGVNRSYITAAKP